MIRTIKRLLAPLDRRMRAMISRGVITRLDDSKKLQSLQVSGIGDEVLDRVERVGEYGFASQPSLGSEVIVISPLGIRSLAVVVAVEDRTKRPTDLQEGDCALYTHDGVLVRCTTGPMVELGISPSEYVALADQTKTQLDNILTYAQGIASAISGGVPAPNDGGAALKSTIVSALPSAPTITAPASTQVMAK